MDKHANIGSMNTRRSPFGTNKHGPRAKGESPKGSDLEIYWDLEILAAQLPFLSRLEGASRLRDRLGFSIEPSRARGSNSQAKTS